MRNFAELMINGTSGLSSALVEADKAASIADVTAYTDDSRTYVMEVCRTSTGTNPEARDLEAAKILPSLLSQEQSVQGSLCMPDSGVRR